MGWRRGLPVYRELPFEREIPDESELIRMIGFPECPESPFESMDG
jgi:hypothetical protein